MNCVGLSVDTTSVNIGRRNSIETHVLALNPAVYVMGCPCHILHNIAGKASKSFENVRICTSNMHTFLFVLF